MQLKTLERRDKDETADENGKWSKEEMVTRTSKEINV